MTSTLKTLFTALSDALLLLAEHREPRVAALARAHHDTEDPATDAATIEAARLLTESTTAVTTLYLAVADKIDADHAGSVDPVGMGAPITAASLRLEGTFATYMPVRWLKELGGAYGDVADAITEPS